MQRADVLERATQTYGENRPNASRVAIEERLRAARRWRGLVMLISLAMGQITAHTNCYVNEKTSVCSGGLSGCCVVQSRHRHCPGSDQRSSAAERRAGFLCEWRVDEPDVGGALS